MKILSLFAYFLIFLPGSMILLPWGLFLFTGLFTAEVNYKALIILADISLISLVYFSTKPITKLRLAIETIAFLLLLLPIVFIVNDWPWETFNYFLFIAPFLSFVILYLISLWRYFRLYRIAKPKST